MLGVVAEATLELVDVETLACEDEDRLELETLSVEEADEVESGLLVVETSEDVESVDEEDSTVLETDAELLEVVGIGCFTTGAPPAHAPLYAAKEPLTSDIAETALNKVQESAKLAAIHSAVVSQRARQSSRDAAVTSRLETASSMIVPSNAESQETVHACPLSSEQSVPFDDDEQPAEVMAQIG